MAVSIADGAGDPSHFCRITPLASISTRVGQPRTLHSFEIGPSVPPPFQNDRQVILYSFMMSLRASRSSSLFTPIRANGLLSSLFTSDRSCGNMARQGPHQNPQKSSNTTFPR
jgi:hypothetical protein